MVACSSPPDLILVVLGGNLVRDSISGRWRTTHFDEGDNFGILGDFVRVHAAALLLNESPSLIALLSGGRGQLREIPDSPPVAMVMRDELIALGISPERLIVESRSNNTYEQLFYVAEELARRSPAGSPPPAPLQLLSNRWHLPRISLMLQSIEPLREAWRTRTWETVAAEDVLLAHDLASWEPVIARAYGDSRMVKRQEAEARGIADLRAGRYTFSATNEGIE